MLFDVIRSILRGPAQVHATPIDRVADVPASAHYDPSCFQVDDVQSAKNIILTVEGLSTEERWLKETPVVADAIIRECGVRQGGLVIDYGCGIGRIAKELIAKTGTSVLGVDISASMCQLANGYVADADRFAAVSPAMLDVLLSSGLRADAAYSVWVLQHCFAPDDDIARIHRALKMGGSLHVVNNISQAIPTNIGWRSAGQDVHALLRAAFTESRTFKLPQEAAAEGLCASSYCATFQKTRESAAP